MAIKARFKAETLTIDDPREMPVYSIVRAAHYLRLPAATLRTWVAGRSAASGGRMRHYKPLLELPDPKTPLLSFSNLAEAHVLGAFRREHKIPLARIRSALNYVRREFGWKHPLLEQKFATDGVALFIEHLGKIVDASGGGQVAMREVVEAHLKRLERERQQVVRLYPFTRLGYQDSPRWVFMDTRFAFGKPVLGSVRVPTIMIAERYKAGESIDELAEDYGCQRAEIEEGLRCELDLAAA